MTRQGAVVSCSPRHVLFIVRSHSNLYQNLSSNSASSSTFYRIFTNNSGPENIMASSTPHNLPHRREKALQRKPFLCNPSYSHVNPLLAMPKCPSEQPTDDLTVLFLAPVAYSTHITFIITTLLANSPPTPNLWPSNCEELSSTRT